MASNYAYTTCRHWELFNHYLIAPTGKVIANREALVRFQKFKRDQAHAQLTDKYKQRRDAVEEVLSLVRKPILMDFEERRLSMLIDALDMERPYGTLVSLKKRRKRPPFFRPPHVSLTESKMMEEAYRKKVLKQELKEANKWLDEVTVPREFFDPDYDLLLKRWMQRQLEKLRESAQREIEESKLREVKTVSKKKVFKKIPQEETPQVDKEALPKGTIAKKELAEYIKKGLEFKKRDRTVPGKKLIPPKPRVKIITKDVPSSTVSSFKRKTISSWKMSLQEQIDRKTVENLMKDLLDSLEPEILEKPTEDLSGSTESGILEKRTEDLSGSIETEILEKPSEDLSGSIRAEQGSIVLALAEIISATDKNTSESSKINTDSDGTATCKDEINSVSNLQSFYETASETEMTTTVEDSGDENVSTADS